MQNGKGEYSFEIRSIVFDGTKNMYEMSWPDYGFITINNKKVTNFVPLQLNSCLKKRKDDKLVIDIKKYIQIGQNTLLIKE